MVLGENYLDSIEIADLLNALVARREKIFTSSAIVGEEAAKRSYDDVVLAIAAVKSVIARLVLG